MVLASGGQIHAKSKIVEVLVTSDHVSIKCCGLTLFPARSLESTYFAEE